MNPVFVIGGASVDTIVHLDDFPAPQAQTLWANESYRAVGSTGVGKALNLKALGVPVQLHAVVGPDDEGRRIRDTLNDAGVSTLLSLSRQPTEQHVNLMTPRGERLSIFAQPPAQDVELDWPSIRQALQSSDIAVVNILDYARPVLAKAKHLGVPIWTDLHDYDGSNPYHEAFIEAAEVVFLASDNLPDYRKVMEQLINRGKRLVVCTHGAKGATLVNEAGDWLDQPAYPVERVRDSNGAGDAFFSGYLYGHLRGLTERKCLQLAAANGALCVTSEFLAASNVCADQLMHIVELGRWPAPVMGEQDDGTPHQARP